MELREELEQKFASAEMQSDDVQNNDVEEQTQVQPTAEVDEWSVAPKSYKQDFQDNFKSLPQNWRQYLIEREKQAEKGFSDLGNKVNSYKYVDDIFNGRQQRLAQNGINTSKDYFNLLASIEEGLNASPAETIKSLADAYGVNFDVPQEQQSNALMQQLRQLQDTVNQQQAYFKAQQQKTVNDEVNAFVNAKDDAGNAKHPYFEEVKAQMGQLLGKGVASNLEDAYNQSIWLNEAIRNKIIAEKSQADLNAKVISAEKAKSAGFNPSSKATAPERELSLREELEKRFNDLTN